jgi:trigger factor
VKTDVEELSPTRVRLSVEVPFDELKPSLDKAYREVGRQVRIPGFRPGRVPPPVIDRRVGRDVVLSQAVNDAIPDLYAKAVADGDVYALGQPEVEITSIDDGKELTFTVEVDIRPKFELPDFATLSVTVDDTLVTPDEVAEYLGSLQERFASLKGVQRPVQADDYVSIDLSATVDGKPVEDAQASGLSYQVGSESMLDGLDTALTGMAAGDSATFQTELAGGEFAGREADVTVTVHSVKVKEVPGLDDEFAQLASEFDTLGELRADTRAQLERMKSMQQVVQARDRALDALVDTIDIPLPDSVVTDEANQNRESVMQQLTRAGATLEGYLEMSNQTAEQFEADVDQRARRSVKVSLILDQLARTEELGVDQAELSAYVTRQAEQMGVAPERLAQQLADSGQLSYAAAEVLRGKAMNLIAERVKVTDSSGHDVDVRAALNAPLTAGTAGDGAVAADDDAEVLAETDPESDASVAESSVAAEATPAEAIPAGEATAEVATAEVATAGEATAGEATADKAPAKRRAKASAAKDKPKA